MLGCQDFCGYYDWTFHHVRRQYGQQAVADLWARAIGEEAQQHYLQAGREDGLRGLLRAWTKTGEDEQCDWTFTLDEQRNVLRWDMRQCPSKGFLLANDLNADEDYCDHCMGWMIPLLNRVGVEVSAHEHNHCGQCWGEMRLRSRPHQPLELPGDIRNDPRWQRGYIDRFRGGVKLPLLEEVSDRADPCTVLEAWFKLADHVRVVAAIVHREGAAPPQDDDSAGDAILATDAVYISPDAGRIGGLVRGVLIGDDPQLLPPVAARFLATPAEHRPLLMHAYLPGVEPLAFAAAGLPRPVPILPQLIRTGLYIHHPHQALPSTGIFLIMLAASLGKSVSIEGIDLPESLRKLNDPGVRE